MHSSGTNMPCPANGGYPSQPISFCGILCRSRKTDSAGSSKASSPFCPHCLAPSDSSLFENACSYYSFSQLFMFLYPITGHWKNEWLNLIIFIDLFCCILPQIKKDHKENLLLLTAQTSVRYVFYFSFVLPVRWQAL